MNLFQLLLNLLLFLPDELLKLTQRLFKSRNILIEFLQQVVDNLFQFFDQQVFSMLIVTPAQRSSGNTVE